MFLLKYVVKSLSYSFKIMGPLESSFQKYRNQSEICNYVKWSSKVQDNHLIKYQMVLEYLLSGIVLKMRIFKFQIFFYSRLTLFLQFCCNSSVLYWSFQNLILRLGVASKNGKWTLPGVKSVQLENMWKSWLKAIEIYVYLKK